MLFIVSWKFAFGAPKTAKTSNSSFFCFYNRFCLDVKTIPKQFRCNWSFELFARWSAFQKIAIANRLRRDTPSSLLTLLFAESSRFLPVSQQKPHATSSIDLVRRIRRAFFPPRSKDPPAGTSTSVGRAPAAFSSGRFLRSFNLVLLLRGYCLLWESGRRSVIALRNASSLGKSAWERHGSSN